MKPKTIAEKPITIFLLVALTILLCGTLAETATIAISGTITWSVGTIGQANLQGAAGSELTSSYESSTTQIQFDITKAGGKSWRVDVVRTTASWHANLLLYLKRTGNGTGSGTISGGTDYVEVTASSREFCTGREDRKDVWMQEKLAGVSCALPVASYSTTITFTVVEI